MRHYKKLSYSHYYKQFTSGEIIPVSRKVCFAPAEEPTTENPHSQRWFYDSEAGYAVRLARTRENEKLGKWNQSKAERDRVKDKGGFVGGQLRNNRRKRESVVSRSMLTLDCDHADVGFPDRFAADCKYAAALYSTSECSPTATETLEEKLERLILRHISDK